MLKIHTEPLNLLVLVSDQRCLAGGSCFFDHGDVCVPVVISRIFIGIEGVVKKGEVSDTGVVVGDFALFTTGTVQDSDVGAGFAG